MNDTKDAILLYNATGWGFLPYAWTNSGGLFSALIIGLISVIIYAKLMIKKVTIKLPEQVPPAVSKAFAAIIPGTIAIYTAGIIQFLCTEFLGNGLPELINQYLQIPFQNLSQGLGAIIILVFAVQVFWFFGLHGPNVLAPILDGGYIPLLNDNTNIYNTAMAAGKSLNDVDVYKRQSYYILNGPVVQRSGNGQFAYLETGEGLFMPEGAWHCCHNFSDQKARILYFITPKAWSESIPPAVIPSDEETKFYKGPNNDTLPDMRGKIQDISRQGLSLIHI